MHDSSTETLIQTVARVSKPVRYAATAALSLLALFLLLSSISALQTVFGYTTPYPNNTITVSGEGTATAVPDTATVSFGVTATAADVATAQTNATKAINDALASVKASGIADKDITTESFNVNPHYTSTVCPAGVFCPNTDAKISGYDVSENVSVKIRDTTKVAAVLDGLAKAKVTNVSGPDFVVGDTQAVIADARAQAIEKAQVDAQKLATQLHVHLGKIVSYSDSDNSDSSPEPMYKAAAMSASADSVAPSVPTGENTYTKDVSVTYEIH